MKVVLRVEREVAEQAAVEGSVVERARAVVERAMGLAWTDEGEYTCLPDQAAADLAQAGLLAVT